MDLVLLHTQKHPANVPLARADAGVLEAAGDADIGIGVITDPSLHPGRRPGWCWGRRSGRLAAHRRA